MNAQPPGGPPHLPPLRTPDVLPPRRRPWRRIALATVVAGTVAAAVVTQGGGDDVAAVADDARPTAPPSGPVTIAFAGDVHGEGGSGAALRAGLPSIGGALAAADLTVVNLEAAVTEGGSRADKQFAFRVPASTLGVLQGVGVDVVTLANNHGMDFGVQGLHDTLAATQAAGLPAVGIGVDEAQAYAPHIATVRGQRIAVIGATQVLDDSLLQAWTANPGKPGLASAKRQDRLVAEVAAAREQADVVVVYLHWGRELEPCPLPRQQELARALVDAGADAVVGGHAHVLLGGGYLGDSYVDYGLGNFVFNTRNREGSKSGVLTLTVQDGGVTDAAWQPVTIRSGAPEPLAGAAAEQALQDKLSRRSCTDLAPAPIPP